MKLSKRLAAAYDMVPKARCIADVGTDHGYLAAALLQGGKADYVIAIDVNKGPLASARAYLKAQGLEGQSECRLGNGLTVVKSGEVDVAVLCGMGGFLMADIVKAAPTGIGTFILQPQNGHEELKRYLYDANYGVMAERLIYDSGHYYEVWRVEAGKSQQSVYAQLPVDSILWELGALLYGYRLLKAASPQSDELNLSKDVFTCKRMQYDPLWPEYIAHRVTMAEKALASIRNGAPSQRRDEQERAMTEFLRKVAAL